MNEKELESLIAATSTMEPIAGFTDEQMASCPSCSRKNAPNRLKCIYCGAKLEITATGFDDVRLAAKQLEPWQKGWNVVVRTAGEEPDDSLILGIADEFSIEKEFLTWILDSSTSLPLVCLENEEEAVIWARRLMNHGLESDVIADESLHFQTRPRRLREIRFNNSTLELIDFNTQSVTSVSVEMLRTIVTGVLFTDKSETLEKRKRGKSETVEESESYSDEVVIDIYFDGDEIGCRILASGFDFSCLESEKSRISGENCAKLLDRLTVVAPEARSVTNYRELRPLLSEVWGLDKCQEFLGPQRSGLMSAESRRQVKRTNITQFTKFSRLQNLLG
jgi:hypothetical protein